MRLTIFGRFGLLISHVSPGRGLTHRRSQPPLGVSVAVGAFIGYGGIGDTILRRSFFINDGKEFTHPGDDVCRVAQLGYPMNESQLVNGKFALNRLTFYVEHSRDG